MYENREKKNGLFVNKINPILKKKGGRRMCKTEKKARKKYILAELGIYFGWPAIVAYALNKVTNIWIALSVAFLLMMWPVIKGIYATRKAKKITAKDPRPMLRSSSFWYDGFMFWGSPILREIRLNSAQAKSLDIIYNATEIFGIRPRNFPDDNWANVSPFKLVNWLIKKWSYFWLRMPIAQDVRSRLKMIENEYYKMIKELAIRNPGSTIRILEVAGGTLQAVIQALARAESRRELHFDYRVVSIEPDDKFAKQRALQLIKINKLDPEKFHFIASKISIKKDAEMLSAILSQYGYDNLKFDIFTCIGLGDYYRTYERIIGLLTQFRSVQADWVMLANVSDNFVERFFLHVFIQWPMMKYRSFRTWHMIVDHVFYDHGIEIKTTPHKIFNIAILKKFNGFTNIK